MGTPMQDLSFFRTIDKNLACFNQHEWRADYQKGRALHDVVSDHTVCHLRP